MLVAVRVVILVFLTYLQCIYSPIKFDAGFLGKVIIFCHAKEIFFSSYLTKNFIKNEY